MKTILASLMLIGAAAFASAERIVDVKAEACDGFGGDLGSILSRCQTKAGGEYSPVVVSHDVSTLKESREFNWISAETTRTEDGVTVVFKVSRKIRFLKPVTVTGATVLKESEIARKSELKDGHLYGDGDLADAAAKIVAAYLKKDYIDVKVATKTEPVAGNVCKVSFIVDEGDRTKIGEYVFKGADESFRRGLLDAIGSFRWWDPTGWFSSLKAPVSARQITESVARIEEFFRDRGYLDVEVGEPERVANEKTGRVDIVYPVEQGRQYRLRDIDITGLKTYSKEDVLKRCRIPEGQPVAGWKTITDIARSIEIAVGSGDSGLADTHVSPQYFEVEGSEDALDVVYAVEEGVPVAINLVEIQNNDYTKDKVIRREITLSPGSRMLEDKAEESKNKLENLGYFSRVRYSLRPTSLGKNEDGCEWRDLVYEVDEKSTGNFMFGVGASSVDSVFFSAEVQQSNFDLFAPGKFFRGAGQKARLYVQAGPRIQTYEASWTEPWLFDRQLELTVDAYRRQRWYDDYDIIRSGGGVQIAYPVKFWPGARSAFGKLGFRLNGEFIQFHDVEKGEWEYKGREVSLKEEDRRYGDAFEPVVRVFWARDQRDVYRFTRNGSRTQIFADFALAGDNKYYRVGFDHRTYLQPWKRLARSDSWLADHVFMIGARAETIDGISDDVPIYNRYFLGGPKSIRGIRYRDVSPYAQRTDRDGWDPWGGQTLFCMNAEYTVPVFSILRIAAFSDAGSVGEDEFDVSDDFAWTAGLGIRLDIPMFPLRLDFGTPIEKPDHAKKEVFSFTVGYDF